MTVAALIKVVVIAVVLLIPAVLYGTADHWWRVVRGASVAYNGQPSNARVYRSRSGDLLIDLREHGEWLYRVHYYEESGNWHIGQPNAGNFHFLPGYALSENNPAPVVDMGGPKDETDPELVVGNNFVDFTSHKKARIHVTWQIQ